MPTIGPANSTAQKRKAKHKAVTTFSVKEPSLIEISRQHATLETALGSGNVGPAMPRTPQPKPVPMWEIFVAKAKAVRLGTVEVPDADAAIEVAAKQFNMDPKRLMPVRRG